MLSDISKVLVTADTIKARNEKLGEDITDAYRAAGAEEIVVICITNGSVIFAADLIREIPIHLKLDCIRVSSYQDDTSPVTEPNVLANIRLDIKGTHVLLIDDILDTGKTLSKIAALLKEEEPASLKTCVLLSKEGRRQVDLQADFRGFEIPDEFVVGYGLDFAERYRNLPFIGVLKPELQP